MLNQRILRKVNEQDLFELATGKRDCEREGS
jgi:hypothetical protein